jgi:hypothetical protein
MNSPSHYPHLKDRFENLYPHETLPQNFNPQFNASWHDLTEEESLFLKQLDELKQGSDKLWENGDNHSGTIADSLYSQLTNHFNSYMEDKNPSQFQKKSIQAITEVDQKLSKNHQLKKILLNLTLAVISIGVGYVIAMGINKIINNQYTFFNKHKLSDHLASLKQHVSDENKPKTSSH